MTNFKGFKTKADAKKFVKEHGGLLCYEKSEFEKRGRYPKYYNDCVVYGGLSREYKYAVQWNF